MSLLGHALDAVRRGFHIFPVEPGGKTPARLYPHADPKEKPWTYKWSEVATNNPATVIQWWNECPTRNIGIACKPSGLLVVDCDMKPTADGWVEWVELASEYDPEWYAKPTLLVRTGGGGAHVYFRWPSDVQASQSGVSEHVDIRSNGGQKGGYVLAAGSVTSKGTYAIEDDDPIVPAPAWLVELCRERPRPKIASPRFAQPGSVSFAGLQTAVAAAVDGNRNQVLLWAARTMVEDGADEQQIIDTLSSSAASAGLPHPEIVATIRSAYRLQSGKT